jgi:hypothetical protein
MRLSAVRVKCCAASPAPGVHDQICIFTPLVVFPPVTSGKMNASQLRLQE